MLPYQSLIPAQAQPYLPTSSHTLHLSTHPNSLLFKSRGAEGKDAEEKKSEILFYFIAPLLLCTPAALPSGKVANGNKVTKLQFL
jgi:hypothetical protein